ncbi:MAG: ATP-binding protein [Opitutaceae bacterium]
MTISPRTAAIYGLAPDRKYTREEMRLALHPDDRDRARNAAKAAAAAGTDYEIEYRVMHPALGLRWVAVTGRPIFGADGELAAMMGVVQDITDRKNAENVLRTQNEVLERHVAERTVKLRETIGELEAFSYSVSHDMRAPLRSMHSYAELLLEEHSASLAPAARHYLTRIRANAERLELLVRDVLAYSKVAKEEIELKPLDLDAFLPALVQQMPESHASGVTISIQPALPRVLAHEAYLSQIFTNLVANAVKFVAPGASPLVEIAAIRREGDVKITVRDNGIGIDAEDFDRIFQIFGRVHADRAFEGTGIGLAIAKKAVQRMGGDIGVESVIGAGSTFWFTLPKA